MRTSKTYQINKPRIRRSRPSKRRVTYTGKSLLRGGAGKSDSMVFRGRRYWWYDTRFFTDLREPKTRRMLELLRKHNYIVRFTKATVDGALVGIYTSPAVPDDLRFIFEGVK